jgi:two-component system sensor histidine kinase CpxA
VLINVKIFWETRIIYVYFAKKVYSYFSPETLGRGCCFMKIKLRFSLFWKVYLTMLAVLFLPVIIFALLDLFRDDEGRHPHGIIQNLAWNASKIAEESELVDDEFVWEWIADVSEESDLEIYIRRDGAVFFSPDSEWIADYGGPHEPRWHEHPILSSARTRSGRTEATVAIYPFGGRHANSFRRPRVPLPFLVAVVICLVFSFLLVRNFITPLLELSHITGKMQNGDLSVQVSSRVTGRGDEFADLGRSFNRMAKRVENLLSSQKRLLSDISHEIRSPLQCVEVAVALLRRGCGAEAEKYIDRIELEIRRIDDMVEELLTLTRLEEMPIARDEIVRLDEIIRSIVDDVSFAHNVEKDNMRLNLQKLSVPGDAVLLSRALGNVIFNAVRYSTSDTSVEIETRQDGERIVVTVRDHGQGVSEDELEKIFLPYYRTDKARVRSQGGVGLGLAISKRIIESYGGDISASNAPSGGLIVKISLTSSAPLPPPG